jgi:hypothetical protein
VLLLVCSLADVLNNLLKNRKQDIGKFSSDHRMLPSLGSDVYVAHAGRAGVRRLCWKTTRAAARKCKAKLLI